MGCCGDEESSTFSGISNGGLMMGGEEYAILAGNAPETVLIRLDFCGVIGDECCRDDAVGRLSGVLSTLLCTLTGHDAGIEPVLWIKLTLSHRPTGDWSG